MTPQSAGQLLINTFDTVRVINLLPRQDRRKEILLQLSRLGLSEANPKVALFPARSFKDPAGFPTTGARGCFHSHLAILEGAIADGSECVLILEDDVDFVPEIGTVLPRALAALSQISWSIFYGGTMEWESDALPQEPISIAKSEDRIMTTHFVAFRGDAIPRAVAFLHTMLERPAGDPDGGPMHVDGAYTWLRRLNPDLLTVLAIPVLGYQRASRTDIHQLRFYDRMKGLKQFVAFYRRLRNRRRSAASA